MAEEIVAEEEEARRDAQPRSLHDLEAEKAVRLAEWQQQLSTEEIANNTNFAPVKGDWRARVAASQSKKARTT